MTSESEFWTAVAEERFEEAKRLLESYANLDVNWVNPGAQDCSVLHLACHMGLCQFLRLLILHPSINVNRRNFNGNTGLHLAAQNGNVEIVRELLRDARVEVNHVDLDGQTPLWQACFAGNAEVVKWFLVSGRELRLDKKGQSFLNELLTPLEIASRENHQEIVALLERAQTDLELLREDLQKELGCVSFLCFTPSITWGQYSSILRGKTSLPTSLELYSSASRETLSMGTIDESQEAILTTPSVTLEISLPPSFNPSHLQLSLDCGTSLYSLKEKIQDLTGIPLTQQIIHVDTRPNFTFADDLKTLMELQFQDQTTVFVEHSSKEKEIPVFFERISSSVKDSLMADLDERVQAFLTVAASSNNLRNTAARKREALDDARFISWVHNLGSSFLSTFRGEVREIPVTEENSSSVHQGMLKLSKELGMASSKSKFRKEISSLLPENTNLDASLLRLKDLVRSNTDCEWIGPTIEQEELQALHLHTISQEFVPSLVSSRINQHLADLVSEELAKPSKAKEKEGKPKEKEKDKASSQEPLRHLSSKLLSACSKLRRASGVLYRGSNVVSPHLGSLQPGAVVVWPAFTSCTTNYGTAKSFAEEHVLRRINLPTEFGAYLKEHSAYHLEDEVLLPPYTYFKITSVERYKGGFHYFIKMDCLGVLSQPKYALSPAMGVNESFWQALLDGNVLYFLQNPEVSNNLGIFELVNTHNQNGQTPLYLVSRFSGNERLISWLIQSGAKVSTKNKGDSATALHGAVAGRNKGATKILLQKGADREAKNAEGLTPRDLNPEFFDEVLETTKKVKRRDSQRGLRLDFVGNNPRMGRRQSVQSIVSTDSRISDESLSDSSTKWMVVATSMVLKRLAEMHKLGNLAKEQVRQLKKLAMKADPAILSAHEAFLNDDREFCETVVDHLSSITTS